MTNNHVLDTIQGSRFSAIEFNYQSDLNGQMRPSQSYELDPDTFFITDPELDYTIVAVKERNTQEIFLAKKTFQS